MFATQVAPTLFEDLLKEQNQAADAFEREVRLRLVIHNNDVALAVVVGYEQYLAMQNKLEQALKTIQMCQGIDRRYDLE